MPPVATRGDGNTFRWLIETPMRFQIEAVLEPHIGAVLAKQLDEGDFTLADGSLLGDVPLKTQLDMPRAIDSEGKPRLDVFAFYPLQKSDLALFTVGDVVRLVGYDGPNS